VNDFLGGDGRFAEVTPVLEDTYAGGSVQLDGYGGLRWTLAADGLAGGAHTVVRGWGTAQRSLGGVRGATVQVQAGMASDSTLPQMLFRAGGLNTVRGFAYATQLGRAIWTAQLDLTPVGGSFRPVFFIDAGHAGAPKDLFGTGALVGGGVGLSVYSRLLRMSLVRFDLSHPISPSGGKWRFDVVFQAVR
jgi:hemolysin activation/secretion protein